MSSVVKGSEGGQVVRVGCEKCGDVVRRGWGARCVCV